MLTGSGHKQAARRATSGRTHSTAFRLRPHCWGPDMSCHEPSRREQHRVRAQPEASCPCRLPFYVLRPPTGRRGLRIPDPSAKRDSLVVCADSAPGRCALLPPQAGERERKLLAKIEVARRKRNSFLMRLSGSSDEDGSSPKWQSGASSPRVSSPLATIGVELGTRTLGWKRGDETGWCRLLSPVAH